MKAVIVINMENAAFDDAPASELARILRDTAKRIQENGDGEITLRDINGNTVGYFTIVRGKVIV
jgi:hypothetical protein